MFLMHLSAGMSLGYSMVAGFLGGAKMATDSYLGKRSHDNADAGGEGPVGSRRVGDVVGGTKQGFTFSTGVKMSSTGVDAPSRSGFRRARPTYAANRYMQGRGNRSGSYMRRKFSGQRRATSLGVETKFFDTSLAATAIAGSVDFTGQELNPGTVLCFNAPTQGTGASNREGRKITMQTLEITGVVVQAAQADQTAMDSAPTIFLAVVLDRQTNGGTATGLDSELVYTNPVASGATSVCPLRNMLYSKRFKVLKTLTFQLNQLVASFDGTNMEQEGNHTPFKFFVKCPYTTEFLGNAGTRADITDNGLFLVGAASSTSTVPQIIYNARLRFRG